VKTVEVRMGYMGALQRMLTGEITTIEPSFPASGGLTLSLRGLNVLHRFRTEQHSYSWEDTRDSDIARELGQRPVRQNSPGLGIEVRTAPLSTERAEPYVFMDSQYDVVFLMNRARRHGYELVLKEEEQGGQPSQYLYFGPSENQAEPPAPYLLEWGRSLVSFRPTLTTATQVSEVVVKGWDRRRNRTIEGKATWQDLVPRGPERERMEQLAQAFGNRREIVTDRPVHTRAQAESLARDLLRDRLKGMVKASGSTVGLPGLRAGRRLRIGNLGPRFDGEYFVTKTTHTLGDGGYTTEFEARREGDGEGASVGGGG
jgi:phage protein D